jgi:proliferating cell nuclear antigen
MNLIIANKSKLEAFVAIFQLLKNWGSHVSLLFDKDKLYIQSMDKSHVCLADIIIKDKWFSQFNFTKINKLSVNSTHFSILMNYALKHDALELKYDENEPDKLFINFLNATENKGLFNHFFELNLIEIDEDSLGIPEIDYDVEFTIESKKLSDIFNELNVFGEDLNIKCSETKLELNTHGDATKLKIDIPIDDLDEYAISEDKEIDILFSLNHLCKMCVSMKIGSKISIGISDNYPMSLNYDLGDNSSVSFFIAPKISDD